MPILIAILGAIGGAIWWYVRSNPRGAIQTADDILTTARNAPRRFAFRRQTNAHPVEGIEDPMIAVVAIAQAFLELDDLPTQDQRNGLNLAIRKDLRTSEEEAEELQTLGRWLQTQCGGPQEAISRIARKLYKIDGDASFDMLLKLLNDSADADGLSDPQREALDEIKRAFRIR
ncbi:hypothetical protein AADZ90_008340 [Aestuariibius sp. 2305UL40-4]|uniref:hypothetical protein n=1 Tax=Aestuariibius violaceus TaxID=3234132 RepID=UPI00345E1D52